MAIRLNLAVSHRGRSVLAILFLFGAGALQCRAQGCNGVPPSTTGSVTWSPQWCQEFNATTPGRPDTTEWAFDLGNGGFGNNEIETYCGPPGYSENPSNCPTTFAASASNAYVDGNGHLMIQAINNSGTWFSGRMKTQGILSMSSLYAAVYARISIFYYSLYRSSAFRCQLNGRAAIQA
jgi:hypothetical protein